jgi:hypothetical protein
VNQKLYNYLGSTLATIGIYLYFIYALFLLGTSDEIIALVIENAWFGISFFCCLLATPILATVYFSRKQKSDIQQYINISILKYLVAFLMFYYGYSKMHSKFFEITYLAQDSKLADIDGFFLTWYYYGRSNSFEFLIGLSELVPAIFLLFRRTSFIGSILLLPVAINVFLVNFFNQISGITFIVSIAVVIFNFYILSSYYKRIVAFLLAMSQYDKPALNKSLKKFGLIFKILIIGTILFCFIAPLYFKIINHTQNYTQRNKIRGGFELLSLRINNIDFGPETNRFYKSIYLEPQSRWNTVRTFSRDEKPMGISFKWNTDNDSVITYIKLSTHIEAIGVDSSSMFIGTYRIKNNTLYVDGIQNKNVIHATYRKKPLKDYNWFF